VSSLEELQERITGCQRCERLVEFREKVAAEKRRAYRTWDYWGKPVPSFGDALGQLLIVGLAPGAHGANRTGRMFTGDSSGDFLYSTLQRFGFCNQPTSTHRDDGLELNGCYITAALHCVPPSNRPLTEEASRCRDFLAEELRLLARVKVVVALCQIAYDGFLRARRQMGKPAGKPKPRFCHGEEVRLDECTILLGSYHPSRQNTQTGRLTRDMFDSIFRRARELVG
jgi:uracil-DNA glycosylase family 4